MSNEQTEALERARILSEALDSSEKPKIGEGQYGYAKRADLPRMLREQAKDALFFECAPHVTVDAWNIVQMAADELEAALATASPAPSDTLAEWAVSRWRAEVEHRPLANIHRRSLDDAWRQVMRFAGLDDVAAVGPAHDDLIGGSHD